MSVCRVFVDRAVRTTVLLACLLAWTPASGGDALPSGGDAKNDLRARNEIAIAGAFAGAGLALMVAGALAPASRTVLAAPTPGGGGSNSTAQVTELKFGGTTMIVTGVLLLLLGGIAMSTGGGKAPDAQATATTSPPAERGTLTITGASVGGQAAAGVALSF